MLSKPTAEAANETFVQRNRRWNFSVNLLDIAFITISLSLVSRETLNKVAPNQIFSLTYKPQTPPFTNISVKAGISAKQIR
jgi:hypothetical protein